MSKVGYAIHARIGGSRRCLATTRYGRPRRSAGRIERGARPLSVDPKLVRNQRQNFGRVGSAPRSGATPPSVREPCVQRAESSPHARFASSKIPYLVAIHASQRGLRRAPSSTNVGSSAPAHRSRNSTANRGPAAASLKRLRRPAKARAVPAHGLAAGRRRPKKVRMKVKS